MGPNVAGGTVAFQLLLVVVLVPVPLSASRTVLCGTEGACVTEVVGGGKGDREGDNRTDGDDGGSPAAPCADDDAPGRGKCRLEVGRVGGNLYRPLLRGAGLTRPPSTWVVVVVVVCGGLVGVVVTGDPPRRPGGRGKGRGRTCGWDRGEWCRRLVVLVGGPVLDNGDDAAMSGVAGVFGGGTGKVGCPLVVEV